MLFRIRRYLDNESAGGGGTGTAPPAGGSGSGSGGGGTTRLPSRAEGEFQGMLLRTPGSNDAERAIAAARTLYDDNHALRGRIRTLKGEVDAFRTRNPQGSVVLHGQELADYNAYKALGKPAEIKTQLDAAAKTAKELADTKRAADRKKAAEALGFNAAVLEDRLTVAGLDVEIREETQADNSKKPVPYVRKAGENNATWEALATVAQRDWADRMPALKAGATAGGTTETVPFLNNGAAGGGTAGSVVDSFIKRNAEAANARPNPLRPQGASTATK